jgi:DNA-binding transcriptional regulator YdaS (Cro superfamily)
MGLEEVYRRIEVLIAEYGTQAAFARAINLSPVSVSDVVKRRKEPGPAMLKAIGVEKVVSYREVK